VVNEAEAGMLWAQYLHLYRNYYVFQYATGISAAHALAERVLAGGAQEVDDYQACLRAGGSLYPLDTLRMAGVDPAQADSVRAGFRKLEEYVVSLEEQFG
jgi:oligoendopeptidase F